MTNMTEKKNHLYTIKFSHYCEKVRWTLDYYKVKTVEHGYLPAMHFKAIASKVKWHGKADRTSSRFSTPLYIDRDGTLIQKSIDIMKYLDGRYRNDSQKSLFPSKEVENLVQHYHDFFGTHTRRIAYYFILNNKKLVFALANNNVDKFQALLCRLFYPCFQTFLAKGLSINRHSYQKSLQYARKEIEKVSLTLKDKRKFLMGDNFTAADISFASLAVPLLMVSSQEGFAAKLPMVKHVPEEFQELIGEFRTSLAGQYALRMFKDYRKV